ncbi:protein croquemort isoform X2 [Dendroctonus ponderosae]|uniref:Protein croquemort n=1 Tax=Dendroctonus ponderosae TaxID=77166 RepID=A0AAR5P939_DENPD|nr:protein croquemort isoform X2 [Dendroctonus ponderosae]
MWSCCSTKCAKWTNLSMATLFVALGISLVLEWEKTFQRIINYELSVCSEKTKGFKMWKETPIPMYLEFHMFNWTNAHLVAKDSGIKPAFVDLGPYVFYEHHIRDNVTFHDNDTITYLNKRLWHFEADKSNGTLEDVITILNPLVVIVANVIKDEHYLVKRAVNFFLEEKGESLFLHKNVRELLFDGYDDGLIDIALKLNISGFNLPFTKFGWFVDRNGSATYDGVFNMYSGGNDIRKLGLITRWNYEHETSYYPGECAVVNGSSGELWYAPHDDKEVAIFSPDMCSNVKLHRSGTFTLYGIEGNEYVGQDDVFDNGTKYESSKCYASGVRTGVRGVSTCKFGAPAYMSYPHFYLADPGYIHDVDGMSPNAELHATKMALEPSTGMPLHVKAAFQLNLLMSQMEGIDVLAKMKTTMMPCFWFAQKAELTEDLSVLAKTILIGKPAGVYTGYGILGLGILLFVIFGFITYKTGWKTSYRKVDIVDASQHDG